MFLARISHSGAHCGRVQSRRAGSRLLAVGGPCVPRREKEEPCLVVERCVVAESVGRGITPKSKLFEPLLRRGRACRWWSGFAGPTSLRLRARRGLFVVLPTIDAEPRARETVGLIELHSAGGFRGACLASQSRMESAGLWPAVGPPAETTSLQTMQGPPRSQRSDECQSLGWTAALEAQGV